MAETMQFDLVSPERRLASAKVSAVKLPGADGDMTAGPGHAPIITTLRPGLLVAEGEGGAQRYLVTGGFAEIGAEGMTVLAEQAYAEKDVTPEILARLVDEAKAAKEAAAPDAVDAAAKMLADVEALSGELRPA